MSLFCLCSLSHLTNFPCHLQIVLQAQQAVLAQLSCPQVCISTGDPNTTQSQPWSATGTSKHSCDIGAGMCSMSPGNRMMKKKPPQGLGTPPCAMAPSLKGGVSGLTFLPCTPRSPAQARFVFLITTVIPRKLEKERFRRGAMH